jgi:hypothetical protein
MFEIGFEASTYPPFIYNKGNQLIDGVMVNAVNNAGPATRIPAYCLGWCGLLPIRGARRSVG